VVYVDSGITRTSGMVYQIWSLKYSPNSHLSIGLLSDLQAIIQRYSLWIKQEMRKLLNYIRTRWRKSKSYHGAIIFRKV
jgi:hypothetical protein